MVMLSADKQFRRETAGQAGAVGREQDALRRMQEFDPSGAVDRTARGAFDSFREDLQREIDNLRGHSVGMGRLNTGFQWDDEGDVVQSLGDRLNRTLAGTAMQSAGMDMANRQAGAQMAGNQATRYYDMLSANRDADTMERNAKRERRGGIASGIGSLLGAGLGAVIPGGGLIGAQVGSVIGGQAGRIFG